MKNSPPEEIPPLRSRLRHVTRAHYKGATQGLVTTAQQNEGRVPADAYLADYHWSTPQSLSRMGQRLRRKELLHSHLHFTIIHNRQNTVLLFPLPGSKQRGRTRALAASSREAPQAAAITAGRRRCARRSAFALAIGQRRRRPAHFLQRPGVRRGPFCGPIRTAVV